MSDQGKNDTARPSGRTWEHGEHLESWREGYRACLETCRATYEEGGAEKLVAMVVRATGGGS